MAEPINIKFPVGRLVLGSLYTPNDKNADGGPLVYKTGQNAGQTRVDYFFALAIAKGPGQTHFAQPPAGWPADRPYWGAQVWAAGHASFPREAQSPSFAWKIEDGDSTVANKRGNRPCDREGYPGHWIVKFSGGYAPKIYQIPPGAKDPVIWPEPGAVNLGDYIEVNGNCTGNNSTTNPGVYINHSLVCFRGYGQRIVPGVDASAAGFGEAPLPAGASAVPLGGAMPPPAAAPGAPAAPVALPPVPAAPVAAAPLPAPYPGFMGAPGAPAGAMPGAPLPVPPAAPVAAAYTMTPKANGYTREQLIAGGWTDESLRANGMML